MITQIYFCFFLNIHCSYSLQIRTNFLVFVLFYYNVSTAYILAFLGCRLCSGMSNVTLGMHSSHLTQHIRSLHSTSGVCVCVCVFLWLFSSDLCAEPMTFQRTRWTLPALTPSLGHTIWNLKLVQSNLYTMTKTTHPELSENK